VTAFVDSFLNTPYIWNGTSWNSISGSISVSALTGKQGGDGTNYYFLGLSDYTSLTNVNSQLAALQTTGSPVFTGLSITGTTTLGDGTAAIPALSFIADTNTGLYRPASDNLAITTGGTQRLVVDNNGRAGSGFLHRALSGFSA